MVGESNTTIGDSVGETVFFSYSRTDKISALPVIRAIEEAGYSVWWDGMLEGGTSFLDKTESALESAKAVVVLWSRNSIGSHWVRDEATSGRERERLIPLSLDGTTPPLGFRQVQFIDMQDWDEDSDAFDELLRGLAKLHDLEYSPVDPLHRLGPAPSSGKGFSRRHVFAAGGVFIGGVASLGLARMFGSQSRVTISSQSLAVLPFENRTGSAEFDYVSEGLASAIRDELSMNPALKVIARSSSIAVMEQFREATDIAKTLKVASLLEGRIKRLGSEVQLSVGLIDGKSGFSQWTEVLPYQPENLLELRDKILQSIIETIAAKSVAPAIGETENAQAFNEYMKGNNRTAQGATLETVQAARRDYERAVEIDPSFSLAHAALSEKYLLLGAVNPDKQTGKALIDKAVASAKRAVEVGPEISKAQVTLGFVMMSGRVDFRSAKAPFSKAQSIGLHRTSEIIRYATYLTATGQSEAAIAQAKRARELDPLNAAAAETLAFAYFGAGEFDSAAQVYRGVLSIDPDRYTTQSRLGLSLIYSGDAEGGLAACQTEVNLMEKHPCDAIAAARGGDIGAAELALEQLSRTFGDSAAYQQAEILAQMGRLDEAMDTLRRAESLGDSGLSLALIDPALTPLRERADYLALLSRLGLSD